MSTTTNRRLVELAILSVFFTPMVTNLVSPGLELIAEAFPNIAFTSIALLFTLPSLMSIPSSLIAGALAGKKCSVKAVTVFGLFFFIVFGVAAFWANNFILLMICRILFGIGLGSLAPLGAALVFEYVEEERRTKVIGIGVAVMNAAGVVFSLIGGWLAVIDYHYMFLGHLLGIPLILAVFFFLPNRKPSQRKDVGVNQKEIKKEKLPGVVWAYVATGGLLGMFVYPVLTNMSTVVIQSGIGNAAIAGYVVTMYTAGGVIGSLIYAPVQKNVKKLTASLGMVVCAVGTLVLATGGNVPLLMLGSGLCGVGFGFYYPELNVMIGEACPPSVSAFGLSMLIAGCNCGMFISPYFYAVVQNITGQHELKFPFFFCFFADIAVAIVYIVVRTRKKQPITA